MGHNKDIQEEKSNPNCFVMTNNFLVSDIQWNSIFIYFSILCACFIDFAM